MTTPESDHSQLLIKGLRGGEPWAVAEFCARFGEPLQRIADKRISGALRRRVGPEDVVQSACGTFFRRVRLGEFNLPDTAALWQLLCAITLTKVREQSRFHLRKKRGIGREEDIAADTGDSGAAFDPVAHDPPPDEAAEFADELGQLLGGLDAEEQQVVDLKLQDFTNDQVAASLGCSERTVRRILKRVEAKFEAGLAGG